MFGNALMKLQHFVKHNTDCCDVMVRGRRLRRYGREARTLRRPVQALTTIGSGGKRYCYNRGPLSLLCFKEKEESNG
jgi:hypothetical protein